MDAISILNGIKNKVLDAQNFDLLKRTYELQNENIEQLKSNNEVFKERNELLQEEVNCLKKENTSLEHTIGKLNQRVSQLSDGSISSGLSKVAVAVLGLYLHFDITELWKNKIISCLSFSTIQIESAIDELKRANFIKQSRASWDDSKAYSLTVQGKEYLAKNI
jgi:predicted nuclease with TOPRIM domain